MKGKHIVLTGRQRAIRFWVAVVVLTGLISGCGGAGAPGGVGVNTNSAVLPPAGSQTFSKTLAISGTGGKLQDTAGTVQISVPAGAMATGAQVKLVEWSAQRKFAQMTPTYSPKAIDLAVVPASFVGSGKITVTLPWQAGGPTLGTILTAFGPSGTPLVLTQTTASTQVAPQAVLGINEVTFLLGAAATTATPVEIELAVEQVPVGVLSPQDAKPTLTRVWAAPTNSRRPTAYASRKRIAVTVHGVMNTSQDVAALTNFLSSPLPTEDKTGQKTYPFDEVYAYDYNWKDTIENNGAALAQKINALYGDPTKYDVHIFGHSMGGIVCRWAIEKVGIPSATQLVTLGSPHKGVPIEMMREWMLGALYVPVTLTSAGLNFVWPGPTELVQGSALLETMSTSTPPQGITYDAIGGTNPGLPTGSYAIALATYEICQKLGRLPCDGFVPLDSSLGGPAPSTLAVPYNHSDLCDEIILYWPGSTAASWVGGMNRSIAKFILPNLKLDVLVGTPEVVTVTADDKDSSKLDPALLFASGPNPPNPALKWAVSDPAIASLSAQSQLSITVTGLKAGTTTLTVTDPATGVTDNMLVEVDSNLGLSPSTVTFNGPGQATFFNVSGTYPSGTTYKWVCKTGELATNGTVAPFPATLVTTVPQVTYMVANPPANGIAANDTLTLSIVGSTGAVLGSASASIKYGGTPFFIANYPYTSDNDKIVTGDVSSTDMRNLIGNATFLGLAYGIEDLDGFFQINISVTANTFLAAGQSYTLDESNPTTKTGIFYLGGYLAQNSPPLKSGTLKITSVIPSPAGNGSYIGYSINVLCSNGQSITGNGVVLQHS